MHELNFEFEEKMILSYQFLLNEERDDDLREFAVELLEKAKKVYSLDWNKDWRNDIF